jgi:glutamate racemase
MRNDSQHNRQPLALFDSGIGGISILREIKHALPAEDVLYLADQAHVPYGPRPLEEIRRFSMGITRFLIDQGSKLVVVACNTASAASLGDLRRTFPGVPFVGMEPAVKPAAETTRSGVVGVLATPTTFQGELYASVVERFAEGVRVLPSVLPGLVEQIEAGQFEDKTTRQILARGIQPLLDAGADTLVLACTHYPFLIPQIREIAGRTVQVIDPSPAIARQAERLLKQKAILNDQPSGSLRFFTSGDPESMASQLVHFGFLNPAPEQVVWNRTETNLAAAG